MKRLLIAIAIILTLLVAASAFGVVGHRIHIANGYLSPGPISTIDKLTFTGTYLTFGADNVGF